MYRKTELKNGVRIITERLEHFRSVSIGIWVGAGSRDEEEERNGISHFIEHMIFKGTRVRSGLQIAKELDAIGGLSNAFTGKEYTCFHSRVLDRDVPILTEIISDIFLNSIFDPLDIDRERQVILQEISMVEDTPDEQIHDLFHRLFWFDHSLGMSILGTADTVKKVDRDLILEHMKRFYTPERIIIAAAGNINHNEIVELFAPIFESLEQVKSPSPGDIPRINSDISCLHKPLEQVHVCLGGKAPHLTSDLRFAVAVLNTILGGNMSSRLFQEIREKRGLAYSIYSFLSAYMDTGLLGICVGTDPREVNSVLTVINREIEKIQNGEVSQSDLEDARGHLVGGIILGSESTDSRMMRLAKNEFVFGRYVSYEEVIEDLGRVTVDEVIACAVEAFAAGTISLATLGPIKREELDLTGSLFSRAEKAEAIANP